MADSMADDTATDAVDLHNRQAKLFQERYVGFSSDPYQMVFTYGRKKTDEIMFKQLELNPPPRDVLDVGCGTGRTLRALTEMGYRCAGADAAEEMLRIAKRENPGADIKKADASSLPFADRSFDIVVSIELLRYIQDRPKCVGEMLRILKPGGVCLVTVAPLWSTHGYALFNRANTRLGLPGFSKVKQYFETAGSARRLFLAAGFKDVEIRSCFYGPFILLEKILPKSALGRILRLFEPLDDILGRFSFIGNFANHMAVIARK